MTIRLPRQPAADPQQADTLNRLARQYAARHGDTLDVTAARRAAMAAELAQHEPRSGSERAA